MRKVNLRDTKGLTYLQTKVHMYCMLSYADECKIYIRRKF